MRSPLPAFLSRLLVAAFLTLAAVPFTAQAQLSLEPENSGPKVTAKLIAEHDAVKPGGDIWVALRQDITPDWHTYWRNPGDTGLPTTIKWDLPEGYSAGEVIFPTPKRFPMAGMMNFGYSDNILLLNKITAPDTAKPGSTVTLTANASWLVCREICIPEKGTYTLELKIADSPSSSPWESAFTATRKNLPATHSARQTAEIKGDMLEITLEPLPLPADTLPEEAFFFPHDGLLIEHHGTQTMSQTGRALTLAIPLNKTRSTPVELVSGDLWLRSAMGENTLTFLATIEQPTRTVSALGTAAPLQPDHTQPDHTASPDTASHTSAPKAPQQDMGLAAAIIFAFLGGLLLNLMPCVFPVLSLKALGLVHKSHSDARHDVVLGGVAYLVGVLASFTLLALVLIVLKQGGSHIGWGLQLQSPHFVAALALLLFFIGYVLMGGMTFGSSLMNLGNKLTHGTGYTSSFFTGALAVLVATPCTAPFMGGAIFYALTQNWFVTLVVLWALGLGLALPYVLLTLFPQVLLRFLPKPGVWMENFKQFLAFPMWGAAIWLVWVLGQQNGPDGVMYVLISMLFLAMGFWLWGTMQNRKQTVWHYTKGLLGVLAIILAVTLIAKQPDVTPVSAVGVSEKATYEPFDADRLQEYLDAEKPVFVNMTAAWCITCLANEKAALSTDAVQNAFRERGIIYMKGDWTNYDDAITEYLKEFGRSGVPIYVFYPQGKSRAPIILPQLLTAKTVLDHLNRE